MKPTILKAQEKVQLLEKILFGNKPTAPSRFNSVAPTNPFRS
jgi:hypothetical protein